MAPARNQPNEAEQKDVLLVKQVKQASNQASRRNECTGFPGSGGERKACSPGFQGEGKPRPYNTRAEHPPYIVGARLALALACLPHPQQLHLMLQCLRQSLFQWASIISPCAPGFGVAADVGDARTDAQVLGTIIRG